MELRDENLKDILSHSKLELPFLDFDNRMLQKIQEYELKKRSAEKNKFFGHLCFLFGILFGIAINYMTSERLISLSTSYNFMEYIYLISKIGYLILIILFAHNILKIMDMDLKKIFK